MKRTWHWFIWLLLPAMACRTLTGGEEPTMVADTPLVIPTAVGVAGTPLPPPPAFTPTPTIPSTPSGSPTLPASPTPTPCLVRNDWPTVTVAAGDTLFRLARRTGSSVDALVQANCLPDRNRISVGQQLRVPRLPAPTATATPAMTATPTATPEPQPTLISDWTDQEMVPVSACYTDPFWGDQDVAVGDRWRVGDGVDVLTLNEQGSRNSPIGALSRGTPFLVRDGPVCFTARFGDLALVFRRWGIETEDGHRRGWVDEFDPFTGAPTMSPAPRLQSFTVSPRTISSGQPVTLAWQVAGAHAVYVYAYHNLLHHGYELIGGRAQPAQGSATYTPPQPLTSVSFALGLGTEVTDLVGVAITCSEPFFVRDAPDTACPLGPPQPVEAAYQPFEHGFMVWRPPAIWVLVTDGPGSMAFVDTWQGQPAPTPQDPPPGLLAPERGFGLVWVENEAVRQSLGWATAPEQAYAMTLQETVPVFAANGYYFSLPDGRLVAATIYSSANISWQFTQRR